MGHGEPKQSAEHQGGGDNHDIMSDTSVHALHQRFKRKLGGDAPQGAAAWKREMHATIHEFEPSRGW